MAKLGPVEQKFILHWGEMGTRWGINRTVAQIHALLYLAPEPLNAEQIAETLSVARSNVSTSLKELQSWGIVRVVHALGDRRDHFESTKDVWEMFRVVLDERKRREIDPTLSVLRSCVGDLSKDRKVEAYTRERLKEMLEFFEEAAELYQEFQRIPPRAARKFFQLKGRIGKLVDSVLGG